MGGIALSLILGCDIQTPKICYQKITTTPPPRGARCLLGKRRAMVWANTRSLELGRDVPDLPSATIGHGDDGDVRIQARLWFVLGPGLQAGLRRQMGRAGAIMLLRRCGA